MAEMKVGIFVTIALLLLSALILQKSWGLSWFTKSVKMITYLSDVGGLKSGAPVWLAGLEIGRVRKITIVPPEVFSGNAKIYRKIEELKKRIEATDSTLPANKKNIEDMHDQIRSLKADIRIVEVQLEIRPQYLNRISSDSEVSIDSRGLIGDSYINISPGTYGGLPPKQGDFYVIESLQRPGFREIMTGANDVVANFGVLSQQIKDIVMRFNADKVGAGIAETVEDVQNTVKQASQTFNRATQLIEQLQNGNGTIGKLVSDPTLFERLVDSLQKFNTIAENIQNGKGTIGKLINDPALFNTAHDTLKKADMLMDRIEKGEGTLGKLSTDTALYEKQGQGTMGKLLKDPSLYNNLDQSSAEITKLLYDLRQDPKKYLTIRFRLF
jgi:phospholipid/cholesterol/gamma-HCH transport system substrate-binding protein